MLKTHGLHSYVLNNNLRSLGLLAGFLLVVQLMFAAIWAFGGIIFPNPGSLSGYLAQVWNTTTHYAPSVLAASIVWAFLAFFYYKHIVRGMTDLHEVTRSQEPRLYAIVENLSIATGLTTPRIEVSETQVLNAFALGLTPATSTIGVTRGLMSALNDQELEAVIAHELTHIRTLDVRLMTFATIFCGIIFSIGWFLTYRFREMSRQAKSAPLMIIPIIVWIVSLNFYAQGNAIYGLTLAVTLVLSALLISLALRFSISRNREFVADLGACELTKNPEALISALVKIHGRNLLPHCEPTVQAMMISAPSEGLFASHPDLEDRIDAIVTYAAQHLNGLRLAPASTRFIPKMDSESAASSFSITKMKYPAWVSKPLIVLPALVTGVLIAYLSSSLPGGVLEKIQTLPAIIQSVIEAPAGGTVFNSNDLRGTVNDEAMKDPSIMGFIKNMSLGEWKIMIIYFFMGLALIFSARLLRSFGFDSNLLRQLAGQPSKEMQSDWDETPPQQSTRVNMSAEIPSSNQSQLNRAMEQAIANHQRAPTTTHSAEPPRAVFGKR